MRVPYWREGEVEEGINPAENKGWGVEDERPVEGKTIDICDSVSVLAF